MLGISTDGKKPLEIKQIARKGEKWLRQTYNNFKACHNLGSILNIHAEDLQIIERDKYEYIMTYSFPLANVRNHGDIIPIDEPRGLPDDISDIVKKEVEIWDGDGHSYSWLTAKEIFIYNNKHSETIQSGLITLEAAKELDENGILPSMWCQWTNQEGYIKRSWKRPYSPVESLIEPLKNIMKEEFHIFNFEPKEKQEKQIMEHADEIRIVFWFDN